MRYSRRTSGSSRVGPLSDDGCRTNWLTAILKGVVFPSPLVVWGFWNLATWSVRFTRRGAPVMIVHNNCAVLGVVLLKWGVAGALFAWYVLANSPRFDRWVGQVIVTSVGLAILGLLSNRTPEPL